MAECGVLHALPRLDIHQGRALLLHRRSRHIGRLFCRRAVAIDRRSAAVTVAAVATAKTAEAAVVIIIVAPVALLPGLRLADPLAVLLRYLLQKARGRLRRRAAKQHALSGIGHGKMLAGAGHGHIAQPPLLLHLLLVAHGAVAGEQAILHAHHEHLREFQALGAVHGHHHHAVVALLGAVQIGVQRHLVQKARQAGIVRLVVQKGVDAGGQFLHVLQPSPAFHVVLFRQHSGIAAAIADEFIKLRQGHLPHLGPHFLHQRREAFQLYSR